jgi:hypothetical protein
VKTFALFRCHVRIDHVPFNLKKVNSISILQVRVFMKASKPSMLNPAMYHYRQRGEFPGYKYCVLPINSQNVLMARVAINVVFFLKKNKQQQHSL